MLHRAQYLPSLVGHLDAILAACTALSASNVATADPHLRLKLEFTAISHVLQIRHDVQEEAIEDHALESQLRLFIAVTDCFEDAASVRVLLRTTSAHDLIGGRIPVDTLAALVTAMRDVFGIWYGFDDGVEGVEPVLTTISEAEIWSTGPDVA